MIMTPVLIRLTNCNYSAYSRTLLTANKDFERWYNGVARWIRKNFARNPIPLLGGYVGPAAYEFFKRGGLLLPMFRPPLTSQSLSWVEAQDQHRALFLK